MMSYRTACLLAAGSYIAIDFKHNHKVALPLLLIVGSLIVRCKHLCWIEWIFLCACALHNGRNEQLRKVG